MDIFYDSVASAECSFSTLRKIKNVLCMAMLCQKKLLNSGVLAVETEFAKITNLVGIINGFA